MSSRKQHAYEVALRMARVKELRAQAALASAIDKETAAQQQVDTVQTAQRSVLEASHTCVVAGKHMDMARYELLTRLDAALSQQLRVASDALGQATQERVDSASQNVSAKRHRERVGEHLDELRSAWVHLKSAKALEDGIELWLESREEGV